MIPYSCGIDSFWLVIVSVHSQLVLSIPHCPTPQLACSCCRKATIMLLFVVICFCLVLLRLFLIVILSSLTVVQPSFLLFVLVTAIPSFLWPRCWKLFSGEAAWDTSSDLWGSKCWKDSDFPELPTNSNQSIHLLIYHPYIYLFGSVLHPIASMFLLHLSIYFAWLCDDIQLLSITPVVK